MSALPTTVQQLAWVLPLTPSAYLMRGLVSGYFTPALYLSTIGIIITIASLVPLVGKMMRRRIMK